MAKLVHPDLSIVCIVNEGKSTEVEEAKALGVELLVIPHLDEPALDVKNVSSHLKGSEIKPVYVLGHDVHTGLRAINLSGYLGVPVALFHHMDYEAYKSFQGKNDKDLISGQENILKKADVVFAIGPKLEESARDKIRGGEKEVCVIKVQPGLAEINPVEMPSCFSAITFGRLDRENGLLKQINLAVASFGEAVNNSADPLGQDPRLIVIGLSNEEIGEGNQSLKSLVETYAKRAVSIYGWSYSENREELFNELRGKTVCMMLSLHEGFGLVGLEAISAEVPLILSKNTGLYDAVDQALGGEGTGCLYPVNILGSYGETTFQENDLQEVVRCLYKIANNEGKRRAKRNAKQLKEKLSKYWTWENAARQVLIGLEVVLKSTHISDTSLQNQPKLETRIEPDQINCEIVLVEQKPSEAEEQLLDPTTQEISVLKVVVNHPVRPRQQVPELKKEINDLNKKIKHCLRSLHNSKLKKILERDSPYPQLFEEIDSNPTCIKEILITFQDIIKKCNGSGSSHQVALLVKSRKLANRSSELLDNCFQKISTLKQCPSRETSLYVKTLGNIKHLFNQIEQNLVESSCHLEESLFY